MQSTPLAVSPALGKLLYRCHQTLTVTRHCSTGTAYRERPRPRSYCRPHNSKYKLVHNLEQGISSILALRVHGHTVQSDHLWWLRSARRAIAKQVMMSIPAAARALYAIVIVLPREYCFLSAQIAFAIFLVTHSYPFMFMIGRTCATTSTREFCRRITSKISL